MTPQCSNSIQDSLPRLSKERPCSVLHGMLVHTVAVHPDDLAQGYWQTSDSHCMHYCYQDICSPRVPLDGLPGRFCFQPKVEALLTGIHSSLEDHRPQERVCSPQIVCSPQHVVSCALRTYFPAVAPAVLHMARQQALDKPEPITLQYQPPLPVLSRADVVLWPGLQMLPETELGYLQ